VRLIAIVAAIALAACAAHRGDDVPATPLENTHWTLVELAGNAVEIEPAPDLTIEPTDGNLRVFGFGGCNRYSGSIEVGETVAFGPLTSTRMACPTAQMDLESALLRAFEATDGLRHDGTELTLLGGGSELARFRARAD